MLVSDEEAIYIATAYEYAPEKNKIVVRNKASATGPKRSGENLRNQSAWGANMLFDSFG